MLTAKTQHDEPLFVNLTPMIDVILTLLIFFMAATKLYDWNEQKLDIQLPEVSAAKPLTEAPTALVLRVLDDESIEFAGEMLGATELVPRLLAARQRYPDQAVVIHGDGRVRYQKVAEVLSACEAAGIRRLAVSVHEKIRGSN